MMEHINSLTYDKGLEGNYFTKSIDVANPIHDDLNLVALPTVFNIFLNMIRYEGDRNVDWLRENYASMHSSLKNL
jgi:hypothetical protein